MYDAFHCPRCATYIENGLDAFEGYCGVCGVWVRERDYATHYYDRAGERIPMSVWVEIHEHDYDYVIIEQDLFAIGDTDAGEGGPVMVSTVWLGMDHAITVGPHVPVIFETMVFGGPEHSGQWRYCTEQEARDGHAHVVAALQAGVWSER